MGLHEELSGIVPDASLSLLPDGYEVIGTIALISIPPGLERYTQEIIRAILTRRPSVTTILNKTAMIDGEYRTGTYVPVYGSETTTEHREYGFRYRINLSNVFFSGKLASERERIAELIKPGETVLVPFAGVGPYAIPAAARGAEVLAVEINPVACRLLRQNRDLNKIGSNLAIIRADALKIPIFLKKSFSRIIIPTPYGLDHSLATLLPMVNRGGTVHWVTFCNSREIRETLQELERKGFLVSRTHRCGNVAPSVHRWMIDITTE